MAALAPLALAASIAGGGVSAIGTIASGNAARDAAYFKAAQEDQQANEARAVSQRQAEENRRRAGLATSRIQALSAASGGGASDQSILKLSGDVAGRGEYQALSDLYTGENRARGLEDAAMADRMTGDAQASASKFKAFGTLLSSAGGIYEKFNKLYG